jgi:hypothetical protein
MPNLANSFKRSDFGSQNAFNIFIFMFMKYHQKTIFNSVFDLNILAKDLDLFVIFHQNGRNP